MSAPASKRDNPRIAELRRLVNDGILSAQEAAPAIERFGIPENSREPDLFRAADAYREAVNTLRESLEQKRLHGSQAVAGGNPRADPGRADRGGR